MSVAILRRSDDSDDLVGELAVFGRRYRARAQRRVEHHVDADRESFEYWHIRFSPNKGGGESAVLLFPTKKQALYEAHFSGVTGLAGRRVKIRAWQMPDSLRIVVLDRGAP